MNVLFEIEIEFLTPCFLGGAKPEESSEFRMSSLKSLLRYWWRQFQNQTDISRMFVNESRIFGSTKKRSKFSLYELDPSKPIYPASTQAYSPPADNPGEGYLFYSCIGRGKKQPGRKRWIEEGSKLKFAMDFLRADDSEIKQVLLSLWLLQTFGGLGSRSRRGAGSFQITVVNSKRLEDKRMEDETRKLFDRTAEEMVNKINSNDDIWGRLIESGSPIRNALTTKGRFRSFGTMDSPHKVLDEIGQNMIRFRTVFTYNHKNKSQLHQLAAALHSAGNSGNYSGPNPIEKTAFGLPIICNFKQRNSTGRVITCSGKPQFERWKISLEPSSHERRASPLFISIKRDENGKYYANLLILWENFLPDGERIKIVKKEPGHQDRILGYVDLPPVNALEAFLRSLR